MKGLKRSRDVVDDDEDDVMVSDDEGGVAVEPEKRARTGV